LRHTDTIKARRFASDTTNDIAGVLMWGKGWSRKWGDCTRRYRIGAGDFELEVDGAGFGQVNSAANDHLVAAVMQLSRLGHGDDAVDLFAGAGNFAIPMARMCRHVTAVESDFNSVEAGRRNAARCRVGNVDFVHSPVESFLEKTRQPPAEVLVLDPPRSGLGKMAQPVASTGAARIIYVSCNPTTLARDVKAMCAAGYRLETVIPIDLFPHTFHVESVCELRLT
jgi:23S rRNA (uracil1939-C5)-methyltransferase